MKRPIAHMDLDMWAQIIETWSGREVIQEFDNLLNGNRFKAVMRGSVKLYYLGEFLMHPDFEAFVEVARARDCGMGIQTNGVLLARSSIRRRLLSARPPGLAISIDGFSAESYEAVRAGSRWATIKKGIEAFIAERDAAGLTDEIPLHLTSISPNDDPESRRKIESFLKTIADGRLDTVYIPLSSSHEATFFDAEGHLEHLDFKPTYAVTPDRPSCAEPMNKMQILSDGQISACCYDTAGDIKVGHVREGVDTVWQSEEMRRLHLAHLRHELAGYKLCQQCLGVNSDGTPAIPAHA